MDIFYRFFFSFNEQKRITSIQADYAKLEAKCTTVTEDRDRLKTYTRELEQINDDLERAQRVVTESMTGFQGMLNLAYEKNALLEMEVEEKEALQVQVQRQLDVIRGIISKAPNCQCTQL